jgi:hypothetical protein
MNTKTLFIVGTVYPRSTLGMELFGCQYHQAQKHQAPCLHAPKSQSCLIPLFRSFFSLLSRHPRHPRHSSRPLPERRHVNDNRRIRIVPRNVRLIPILSRSPNQHRPLLNISLALTVKCTTAVSLGPGPLSQWMSLHHSDSQTPSRIYRVRQLR